jgi:thiol-disulfide isomerase/thioredoxin
MTTLYKSLALTAVLAFAWPLQAAELGDKAPPLKIAEWLKGAPVDVTVADGKRVFVVEFWATWCGPCKTSIPHLTELQKKYKDKNVTFIGISDEQVGKVKPFVDQQGDKMDYVVAIDQNRTTHAAYMGAYGQNGIPAAFLIDQQGRIVWVGHPMGELDQVLDEVLAGKFDLAKSKQKKTLMKRANEYFQAASGKTDREKLDKLGAEILAIGAADEELLVQIAWTVLTDPRIVQRDKAFALQAVELANKTSAGKDPNILDTYALALFENGKKDEAVAAQTQALELAKQQNMPQPAIDQLAQRLAKYKGE